MTEYRRIHHVAGDSPAASDLGTGTEDKPFAAISRAAQVLQPGEKVIVHGGIYREAAPGLWLDYMNRNSRVTENVFADIEHDCIVNGAPCRPPVESARDDVALIIGFTKRYKA